MRALVGPTLRGCLGPDREGSTAAHFMIRASIESVPPIRRIKNREIDHVAPHHPRKGAAGETVGRQMRSQRRRRDHRSRGLGNGDGSSANCADDQGHIALGGLTGQSFVGKTALACVVFRAHPVPHHEN
jgi:hypothetical protein